jgi:hypothetical protein
MEFRARHDALVAKDGGSFTSKAPDIDDKSPETKATPASRRAIFRPTVEVLGFAGLGCYTIIETQSLGTLLVALFN